MLGGILAGIGGIAGMGLSAWGAAEQAKAQRQANADQMSIANRNFEWQRELAQNQIQWRSRDAAIAGFHPLAALGVSPASFSPVMISGEGASTKGAVLQSLGQDISRAAAAIADRHTRAMMALQEQRAFKENQFLDEQIANARAERLKMVGPPMPQPIPSAYMTYRGPNGELIQGPTPEYAYSMMGNFPMQWRNFMRDEVLSPAYTTLENMSAYVPAALEFIAEGPVRYTAKKVLERIRRRK